MNFPIYLDYAATTPIDLRVLEKMTPYLTHTFGNPSSVHHFGKVARNAIEEAREQVAALLQAEASEIIFTSGATESNNLAIKGASALHARKGKHIISMKTEHKAVLDTLQHLEKNGFRVTYLSPKQNGLLDLDEFYSVIRDDTILVSIMMVNNETGIKQDIAAIANITSEKNILFHVDAAQAPGKIAINLQAMPIDLLSLSAHKVYGPKGIGALYLRKKPRVRVEPLLHGGGHEQGMRSGTLPTHQIVGMGAAFDLANTLLKKDLQQITQLREIFLSDLQSIKQIKLNLPLVYTVPHIINLRFENMLADAILQQLPDLAASTASACQGKGIEGSYVLRAMGLTDAQIKSSLRISLGRMTTVEEIKFAVQMILKLFK